jgi:hypothetical protein
MSEQLSQFNFKTRLGNKSNREVLKFIYGVKFNNNVKYILIVIFQLFFYLTRSREEQTSYLMDGQHNTKH